MMGTCSVPTPASSSPQIASLPHLEVGFPDAGGTLRTVLLMLDTGACGADIMLHSRAMREMGMDAGFGAAIADERASGARWGKLDRGQAANSLLHIIISP